jgi:large subunit ribosomal protein L10
MKAVYKSKVADWKKELVGSLSKEITSSKTVAVLNMSDLPSKQLQKIRENVGDKVTLRMARKTLLTLALNASGRKSAAELVEHLEDGMPALLLSELDSFELWQLLKDNMSESPAKPGQKAPFDIVIPAGPTSFAPGPILGELGDVGIKAGINAGKIEIKEDSLVVKEGEEIGEKLAAILSRLNIRPMKMGLNLIVSLEDRTLFMRKTLDVDSEEFSENIKQLHSDAVKLAYGVGIINNETAQLLVQKAETESMKLAYSQSILTDKVKELLLAKANAEATKLKGDIEK